VFILWLKTKKISKSIKNISKSFSIEAIKVDEYLKKPWHRYFHTFLSAEGPRQKTNEDAENFFNEYSLLSQYINLRFWQAVPGILVGLGILGTFVGLTFGISGFNTGSIEKIQTSISTLLSGMGTAFVSSVWGMGFSLIFGYLEKRGFNNITLAITELCDVLDQKFRLTKADEMRFQQEDF
jgi:hypothetical protein